MNFRQFASNNVFRNKRTYVAHFLSSAFSVMIFFTYSLLSFHPNLRGEIVSGSTTLSVLGTMGMKISQVIIFVFSFLFLLYSVSAFIKLRKKEFGILLLLGMSRKQLNRMLFVENIVIGVAAIVTGILVGVVFSKLILLICATMLAVEHGLPFYLPGNAILLTAAAYLALFIIVAAFTSFMTKKGTLAELIKAEDKPKPEPKASVLLSLLSVLLIAIGYACVFIFVIGRILSFALLFGGVLLVIIGTYFLFTQLSVYIMRALKRRPHIFFNRTNLLTISEMVYRMRDNAVMFFMVSIISAIAFTGIGTSLAIGDPGLAAMKNPYAFSYISFNESDYKNDFEQKHIRLIEETLEREGFAYQMASYTPAHTQEGFTLVKLSDYNRLASALGYDPEMLQHGETLAAPSTISQNSKYKLEGAGTDTVRMVQFEGSWEMTMHIKKALQHIVIPEPYEVYIVTDSDYDRFNAGNLMKVNYVEFVVPKWHDTRAVTRELTDAIYKGTDTGSLQYTPFQFSALVTQWVESRQTNGILLIVSGLVGIVFFTFAASFIYFRLYADLSRDEEQYRMISKVGLSRKELAKTVTRQLVLMFFLPLLVAFIHSSVAFLALQQLVDFSVASHTLAIFASFLAIQIIYFFVTRWRYLNHLYQKVM
ncbi:FtsX-like permease family protein [Paenibacillus sp. HJL G12]|uniref:FtsX-like permease family protein n=1 Tax=Paenibacillus dendrobii TaxID=2691084 RepID=A0A7X3IL75_9BACL|nr:ABC transporter permease [Paenibacillus dendrobii]MWV45969.1 FtsX-like permease family protein [Paenibacillus dendrobii]